MPIYINQPKGKLVVRVAGNTETIQLSTANAVAGESISGLHISKIFWSGNTSIARGNTNIFVLTGNGEWELDAFGIANSEDPSSNVVITTDGTAVVELKKQP